MVAETYEERSEQAEYQVELLEGIIFRFLKSHIETKDSNIEGMSNLRQEWKHYLKSFP